MKYHNLFLATGLFFVPYLAFGACSTTNLTRCLDSVCAINIGANPGARCQYCGSAEYGKSTTEGVMKNVTAGTAAKYTISAKELKKAPSDPGQRYIWATEQCLRKVKDCVQEDVDETYDPLIEKACETVGISMNKQALISKSTQTKSASSCSTEITSCIIAETHCAANYKNCELDTDFNKFFSDCIIKHNGCDEFLSDIRSKLVSARDTAIQNADEALQRIVQTHQTQREADKTKAREGCINNNLKNQCIKTVCNRNMPNKCATTLENADEEKRKGERAMAELLCEYIDIACSRLPLDLSNIKKVKNPEIDSSKIKTVIKK